LVVPISSFPELCKLEIEGSKGVVRKSKVDFTSLNSKSLSTISKFRCPVERFMNVEDLTIENCEELMPLWSNDVGLLQPLPRLRELQVHQMSKTSFFGGRRSKRAATTGYAIHTQSHGIFTQGSGVQ
jgi:hypothetical protein